MKLAFLAVFGLAVFSVAAAAPPDLNVQTGSDMPKGWTRPTDAFDYVKRDVMVPMRDGVKLHTVIVVPKGAHDLPIVLTRTPYNAARRTKRNDSPSMRSLLGQGDDAFVADGYIRVYQDIRGKYGSEGDYVMTRPPMGPLNPSGTDDTTDAYDTIDWLVKNLPESNGRVGMIGSSYDGWTVVMALLNPHPALKVAAPLSPMVDGWMGDDWFHHGAFRQSNLDYYTEQMTQAGEGAHIPRPAYDDYDNFRRLVSAGGMAHSGGLDPFPFWQRLSSHPSYDAFWSGQALDHAMVDAMKRGATKVPTLWVQGLWDQEDIYGAIHVWEELTKAGYGAGNHLVMGPWRHSQVLADAASLGELKWTGDTATIFRRDMLLPFFDAYLKDRPAPALPPALIYNTGEDHWDRFARWPGATALKPLYLAEDAALAFDKPTTGDDSYVSDPAKPVPFVPRPAHFEDRAQWTPWLVEDQRFVADRTDVLTYETPLLTKAVRVEGVPYAQLFAKTTGTDADWVVKIIDVFPDEMPETPKMGGYQLAVSLDIFRGRYRESFETPHPIVANAVAEYRFRLPAINHVFEPGHRIMVQIQSSLFPLYDRNPQTYVPNIFFAKPADYRKATMTVERGGKQASAVLLPVVEASTAMGN